MHLHIFNDMHAELAMVHDNNYNSHSIIESDIQKAFDSVPHKALIDKLESIGLNCFLLRWICSYLLNRKQFVVLNGAKSTTGYLELPRVLYRGLSCSIIYINDSVQGSHCNGNTINLFADGMEFQS